MNEIVIKREIFNDAYYPFLESKARVELFMGGGGAGKSVFVTQRDVIDILRYEGLNILAMRKVGAANHDTTFAEYVDLIYKWKLDKFFKINSAKGDERIITLINLNEIIFAGAKDQKELEKLKGIKARSGPIARIRMEEMTEFTENDFFQLNNVRLRGQTKVPKKLVGTLNPVAYGEWIKRLFFEKPMEGTKFFEHTSATVADLQECPVAILKTTHEDNKFYGEEERKELLKLKDLDPYYYKVYVLGEWGILGNRVFTNYVIEEFDYGEDDLENIFQGLDFGFAHAQALERAGFKDGELYVFDELWAKGRINSEFIEDAKNHFGNALYSWHITADSANPDKIDEWRKAGFNVDPAKKGPGSLRFGIEYLSGLKIHIHSTKCPNVAREIQYFKRREDKDGNAIDDFVEINDDGIAALRYGSEHIWGQYHGAIAEYSASDLGL